MKQSDGSSEKNGDAAVLGVGSRLATGPSAELVKTAFAHELAGQLALFRGMSLADLAHTVMLVEAGVIPSAEGASLLGALLALPGACAVILSRAAIVAAAADFPLGERIDRHDAPPLLREREARPPGSG